MLPMLYSLMHSSQGPAFAAFFLLLAQACRAETAAAPQPIPLWPAEVPGEKGDIGEEKDMSKPKDRDVSGRPVVRIGNVSKPSITVYRPPCNKDTGAAVLVCPGGGYSILAWDLEGTEVCEWLNSIGVTGVLLKYRVPARKGQEKYLAPLQDVQRALGLIRQRAKEWGVDSKRVGILGFSAGGHLSAVASNNHETRSYPPVDEADKESCRPDFTILIYPAYLVSKEDNKISPEIKISAATPPAFLAMAQDDNIRVENACFYALALKNAKVPAELHVYPSGGHGFGLRPSSSDATTWPLRAADWLKAQGWLSGKSPESQITK